MSRLSTCGGIRLPWLFLSPRTEAEQAHLITGFLVNAHLGSPSARHGHPTEQPLDVLAGQGRPPEKLVRELLQLTNPVIPLHELGRKGPRVLDFLLTETFREVFDHGLVARPVQQDGLRVEHDHLLRCQPGVVIVSLLGGRVALGLKAGEDDHESALDLLVRRFGSSSARGHDRWKRSCT